MKIKLTYPMLTVSLAAVLKLRELAAYNWFIDSNGRRWYNKLTGGFAAMLMHDPNTGKSIVVLSNKAVIVDNGAIALLENPAT